MNEWVHHWSYAESLDGGLGARHDPDTQASAGPRRAPPERETGRVADREVARRVEVEHDVRTLVEEDTGRRWQVREMDARGIPAAQGARCLILDAETVVRRLWHYPADWRRMPADELLRLAAR